MLAQLIDIGSRLLLSAVSMKENKGTNIIVYLVAGIVGMSILVSYIVSTHSVPTFSEYVQKTSDYTGLTSIIAPSGTIHSLLATTTEDQEKGLGGRISLPAEEGMLFVFPDSSIRSFWMKDMFISLDMVWINADKTVAGISSDVSPSSYPDVFVSPSKVQYVLELNAGGAEKFGIATGTPLDFVM